MILESFSAGYWLAPEFQVVPYNGKRAVIQDDVFYDLIAEAGTISPVAYVGGSHYELFPDHSLPAHVVAIPKRGTAAPRDGDALLISKGTGLEALSV